MWKVFLGVILFTLPNLAFAAGLVPCGGAGEDPCQTCHLVKLISLVSGWLVVILGILATIMIVVSGLRLVTSVGNASAKEAAKKTLVNLFIGYAIILSGWMLVDLGLKTLLTDATYGVWNVVQCTAQPFSQAWSRPTASGDNSSVLPPAAVASRISAIATSGSLQTDIKNAATAAGITNQDQINDLRALISQESSNCTNVVGPITSQGRAYGCGQITIPLAKELDPSLKNLTEEQIVKKLQTDNSYNLALSAKNYSNLLNKFGGETDLALAAYNGGPGANQASQDCPGQKRWQCVWDSPGCYNTGQTNCTPNKGYIETRNYVKNINTIADKL
jgi:hypothetical protein